MSADGRSGVVVIALVGSPFSAAYARDRSRSPLAFCAMNVALYGPSGATFSLVERAILPHDRTASSLTIGPSTMRWDASGSLVIDVRERSTPWRRPMRGTVRLHPELMPAEHHVLDGEGKHAWWPVAPVARVEVDVEGLRFSGHGYHDANAGDVPLEAGFRRWSWSRARTAKGAVVLYDTLARDGREHRVTRAFGGEASESRTVTLPTTRWGLVRTTRSEAGARVVRDLEDGPFYARALVRSRLGGEDVLAMHEELSCDRLAQRWVQFLAGFRMGRG